MSHSHLIACMKWGTRYGPEFVNRLFSSVKRNMNSDFRFICFTDDVTQLDKQIETFPLPPISLPENIAWTPWRKLSLWQNPIARLEHGDILILDIDLVITGSLEPFFTYAPGDYCVIENWTQIGQNIGNTSVFRIPIGKYKKIYTQINTHPDKILARYRIEQQYISDQIPEQKFWPKEWCVSFKHSLLPKFPLNWFKTTPLPQETRIVAFTGHPDPDEARDGIWPAPWYKRHYKHARPVNWIADHWK